MSKKLSTIVGVVKSTSRKSLVVVVSRKEKNSLGRYVSKMTKMHVHDEQSEAKKGDKVAMVPSRPVSKQKTWRLHSVLETSQLNEKEQS